MKKILFSAIILAATSVAVVVAGAGKCSPCQLAKSMRDATAQSIKDAQMAALAVGKPYSREPELEKCSCPRTQRDVTSADIDHAQTVAACCDYCAQPGSLGCQGENSAHCNTCQQGLIKIARVLAAIRASELDEIPAHVSRAPREELSDPCDCGEIVCEINACRINKQLNALRCCCAAVFQRLEEQGHDARKCCKKLKHEIHEVEELVESVIDTSADCCSVTETLLVSIIDTSADCCSVTETLLVSIIDTSAECCSVIETVLGDPLVSSVIDIPSCAEVFSIVDVINSTDIDVIAWLKSLYVLLFQVYQCTCNPCIG